MSIKTKLLLFVHFVNILLLIITICVSVLFPNIFSHLLSSAIGLCIGSSYFYFHNLIKKTNIIEKKAAPFMF
jgi:hypothetical protein